MKQQLITMLKLQDEMNSKVHSDWRGQNFPWYRAIWVECAEMLDHYGWKWWKKQSPDMEQVKLELIDIWHFGLSIELCDSPDVEKIADSLIAELQTQREKGDLKLSLEEFAKHCLQTQHFSANLFFQMMTDCDVNFDSLFKSYIGKNVLNFFRQDNGYKEGSYVKNWGGKEDNEHLVEILSTLDSSEERFQARLYASLAERYSLLEVS